MIESGPMRKRPTSAERTTASPDAPPRPIAEPGDATFATTGGFRFGRHFDR
jgi:hypothetical protein